MARPESYPVVVTDARKDSIFFKVENDYPFTIIPRAMQEGVSWDMIYCLDLVMDNYEIEIVKVNLDDLWYDGSDGLLEFSNPNKASKAPKLQQARIIGYSHAPSPVPNGADIFKLYVELDERMLLPVNKRKS
jgi:hypothetical protein